MGRLIDDGALHAVSLRPGGGLRRIPVGSLLDFVRRRNLAATSPNTTPD